MAVCGYGSTKASSAAVLCSAAVESLAIAGAVRSPILLRRRDKKRCMVGWTATGGELRGARIAADRAERAADWLRPAGALDGGVLAGSPPARAAGADSLLCAVCAADGTVPGAHCSASSPAIRLNAGAGSQTAGVTADRATVPDATGAVALIWREGTADTGGIASNASSAARIAASRAQKSSSGTVSVSTQGSLLCWLRVSTMESCRWLRRSACRSWPW